MSDFINFLKSLRPLNKEEKELFGLIRKFCSKDEIKILERLYKQQIISLSITSLNILNNTFTFPSIKLNEAYENHKQDNSYPDNFAFIKYLTKKVKDKVNVQISKSIAKDPFALTKFIAPNIVGMDYVKKAALLILFAKDPFHILLLGDPGTGKTDILRSVHDLAPVSSFGLGSGTTGVGLAVSVKGKEIQKGLLPLADNGICCIDELNLMKEENRASLYNAMEKGFVTYDKGGNHIKFDARVRVIATANPDGDKFDGNTIKELRKQLPFDSALLTRFHLVFLIRKPSFNEFKEITKKIIRGTKIKLDVNTLSIIRDYIRQSWMLNITIPETLESDIVDFVQELKLNENNYLIEISPRLVVGIVRMAKALARMKLKTRVTKQDLAIVKEIVKYSLKI